MENSDRLHNPGEPTRLNQIVSEIVKSAAEPYLGLELTTDVAEAIIRHVTSENLELVSLTGLAAALGVTKQRAQQLKVGDTKLALPPAIQVNYGKSASRPVWLLRDIEDFEKERTVLFQKSRDQD